MLEVLEVLDEPLDDALIAAWRARALRAGAHLHWPDRRAVARRHAGGASLAIAAPPDQLFLATEVNEWALCAALIERDPLRRPALEAALIAEALQAAPDAAIPATDTLPVIEEAAAMARAAPGNPLDCGSFGEWPLPPLLRS